MISSSSTKPLILLPTLSQSPLLLPSIPFCVTSSQMYPRIGTGLTVILSKAFPTEEIPSTGRMRGHGTDFSFIEFDVAVVIFRLVVRIVLTTNDFWGALVPLLPSSTSSFSFSSKTSQQRIVVLVAERQPIVIVPSRKS